MVGLQRSAVKIGLGRNADSKRDSRADPRLLDALGFTTVLFEALSSFRETLVSFR